MAEGAGYDLAVVVDDDADIGLAARLALGRDFARVETLPHPQALPALLDRETPDVVLLDLNFARAATDGAEGFRWLATLRDRDPDLAVVVITAHGGTQIAVDAIKAGAADFVSKPWRNERLLATVRSAAALTHSRRAAGTERARAVEVGTPSAASTLLGRSAAMARVRSLIERAAPTEANVLILGENGTGKELVARALHRQSRRAGAALVSVDLGAVSEGVFDSELFGHVRGAFTDARAERMGRLQAAHGSTLFLDEIGNLPLHLQPRLLTALEQRQVTPVGANRAVPIDVRIVAATNLAPAQLADEARFRQDLLFRLNTVEIELPPLRERRDDIPELLDHFLAAYARRYARPERAVPDALMRALVAYDWPGNVRALRHAAERAVILAEGDSFAEADFPLSRGALLSLVAPPASEPDDLNLERVERRLVEHALRRHGFNISKAAAELGLTRAALYRRMEKHGL